MGLVFPSWGHEKYRCVNPDLSGVFARLAYQQCMASCAEEQVILDQLSIEAPGGDGIRDLLSKLVIDRVRNEMDDADRHTLLSQFVTEARREYATWMKSPVLSNMDRVVSNLVRFYSSFAAELFSKDFDAIRTAPGVGDDEHTNRIAASCAEKRTLIDEYTKEANEKWNKHPIESYFRGGVIPSSWMHMRVGPGCSKHQIAAEVFDTFISDYRTRAPLFNERVTISGVSIASLPDENRKLWSELYLVMGLKDIPKRVRFIHFTADQPAVAESLEITQSVAGVPDMFKPRRRGRPSSLK